MQRLRVLRLGTKNLAENCNKVYKIFGREEVLSSSDFVV